jgi:hypothetical protein
VNGSLRNREYGEKSPSEDRERLLFFNGLRGCDRNWLRNCWSHRRQAEKEGRAEPQFALTANIPAMGVHDVLGNC